MKHLIPLLLLLFAVTASADDTFKVYAGANAVAFDAANHTPSDFELGGAARASLSPHISLVGSAWQGLAHSYTRATAGARVTATDVNDHNFSVGIGADYQVSTNRAIRPREWCATTSLGWKPMPVKWPKIVLGGQGSYGLTSTQASALIALRYELGSF
jgi:hypothetical protein